MNNPLHTDLQMIHSADEFKDCATVNLAYFIERASKVMRPIFQVDGKSISNVAHEKLLLRLSFDLVESFIEYCPSQLPCRPALLLDSFVLNYFGKPHDTINHSKEYHPLIYRLIDGLLSRATLSRDGLICLSYHLYALKPRKIGNCLGLPEDQLQRIYKNFARWRKTGWYHTVEEAGLSASELQEIVDIQADQPKLFQEQVQRILENLLPFYRKSEPPHYPCLSRPQWEEMVSEKCGLDYRMWHLPFCPTCLNMIANICDPHSHPDVSLDIRLFPYSYDGNWLTERQPFNAMSQRPRKTRKRALMMHQVE